MTLITFPTRVHFADDIVEVALHSELQQFGCTSALLICEASLVDSEFFERVMGGLTPSFQPSFLYLEEGAVLSETGRSLPGLYDTSTLDAVIAFGSARALEMGRKARRSLQDATGRRPVLYALPGVEGLPDPCMRNIETWRQGLPSVLIFDPALIRLATPRQAISSATVSLVRCIESYLSDAFNPPADGMALDGLIRAISVLGAPEFGSDIIWRRDLMAACLNAAIAQEKGVGPTQRLSAALASECDTVNIADAQRLLLPGVIKVTEHDKRKEAMLKRIIAPDAPNLNQALRQVLEHIPLPSRLSDMGADPRHLHQALKAIAGRDDITETAAATALENVF
ncbi:iron-containing alcohol dehydrogenase [Mesorhizobium sp. NBSH29]|uniref:iron-containing alcohol dehydrogenase n=1 Tax=Mesorhizobium sp. NBSH29 TaxID=2654249 RepID=UPI0018963EB5|nr:iron-containing alcohol dehydrogenase [Mesorhizobium sp. NBSH29]QPC88336.1 iron-containing alcohol dehydrogenase [Mesorhizobium sp. NBSH29]